MVTTGGCSFSVLAASLIFLPGEHHASSLEDRSEKPVLSFLQTRDLRLTCDIRHFRNSPKKVLVMQIVARLDNETGTDKVLATADSSARVWTSTYLNEPHPLSHVSGQTGTSNPWLQLTLVDVSGNVYGSYFCRADFLAHTADSNSSVWRSETIQYDSQTVMPQAKPGFKMLVREGQGLVCDYIPKSHESPFEISIWSDQTLVAMSSEGKGLNCLAGFVCFQGQLKAERFSLQVHCLSENCERDCGSIEKTTCTVKTEKDGVITKNSAVPVSKPERCRRKIDGVKRKAGLSPAGIAGIVLVVIVLPISLAIITCFALRRRNHQSYTLNQTPQRNYEVDENTALPTDTGPSIMYRQQSSRSSSFNAHSNQHPTDEEKRREVRQKCKVERPARNDNGKDISDMEVPDPIIMSLHIASVDEVISDVVTVEEGSETSETG
ncbi:hypothetical protein BaRGS_00023015 [Batillaria attramentaria]|uniref:Ig-like domain-containing protein n=1 Tax=Batillaria attramentaria TaxID=370345 RepID=A0ABD0KF26_9CAEN